MPQILLRLLQAVENDFVSVKDLAALVGQDVALAARVVAAANSAAWGRGRSVTTVEECLVVLGTRVVRSMATCLAVQGMFDRDTRRNDHDFSGFWRHSLLCAELSRAIAAECGYGRPDEAYLAGLLHDAGQIILLSSLRAKYGELIAQAQDESALCEMETASLGVHHGEVGAWMVDQWKLDSSLADSILFHHATVNQIATADQLCQIVWTSHLCVTGGAEYGDVVAEYMPKLAAISERLALLHGDAVKRTVLIAEAVGIPVPADDDEDATRTLPKVSFPPLEPVAESASGIDDVVAGMALSQSLQKDLLSLESEQELLAAVRESARILFGLTHTAFLFFDEGQNILTGAGAEEQPAALRLARLTMEPAASLAAESLRTRVPMSSFDAARPPTSLADLQFARAMGTEGVLCIPLVAAEQQIGVMVSGISRTLHGKLVRRQAWLGNFGRLAATGLKAWQAIRSFEQKTAQESSERLRRHARRIAHEAGNPLGIIKSYLKILDDRLAQDDALHGEITVLREEIERVSSIVRRMSETPSEDGEQGVDVVGLARDMLALYSPPLFINRGIAISVDIPEKRLFSSCNRDGLKQILLNLCKNASEAMEKGGRIGLSLREHVFLNGVPHLELTLKDTGPGLTREALDRLRGESMDTAGDGARGIGLSVVGALVKKMGLKITCRSYAGEGTTITLLLPQVME